MKVVLILAACVTLTLAQFSCDSCDTSDVRKERIGCRLFCRFSQGRDVVTRDDLKAMYEADKDTDAGVTRGRWIELMRADLQACDDEASASFDLVSDIGDGPVDLIDETDIDGLADFFNELSGSTELDKETFLIVNDLLYALIGNDDCPIGY